MDRKETFTGLQYLQALQAYTFEFSKQQTKSHWAVGGWLKEAGFPKVI